MSSPLRHAVLGAGGVGGLMAACLAHSDASVTLVLRPESIAHYPERLQLESRFGKFTVSVARAAEVPPCDVLWLTVKATQLESTLPAITHPESVGAIVPLLNGIDHLSLLRGKYGKDKIIPATIGVESERVAPGHIVHRSVFALLNVSSTGRALLGTTLEQLQRLGFDCHFIDDELTMMWTKLIFIAGFALTSTASGMATADMLAVPEWRQLGLGCLREASAVAVAEGARVDADAIIAGALKMPGNLRSSMQKDVERGSPPELDAVAGPILRGASRHGIEVPATKKLVAAIEKKIARL